MLLAAFPHVICNRMRSRVDVQTATSAPSVQSKKKKKASATTFRLTNNHKELTNMTTQFAEAQLPLHMCVGGLLFTFKLHPEVLQNVLRRITERISVQLKSPFHRLVCCPRSEHQSLWSNKYFHSRWLGSEPKHPGGALRGRRGAGIKAVLQPGSSSSEELWHLKSWTSGAPPSRLQGTKKRWTTDLKWGLLVLLTLCWCGCSLSVAPRPYLGPPDHSGRSLALKT